MNQSFYTGAIGALAQQRRLDVQGNNIANVNTYGFKAEKARFTDLMYQDLQGIDGAQLPVGTGSSLLMTSTDFAAGSVMTTNRPYDFMIEGDGFFGLIDLATNEVSFTRSGDFSLAELQRPTGENDENGNPIMETVMCLSDGQGRFVLSNRGDLIEVTDESEELPVGVFDFANYNGMTHVGGNLSGCTVWL